MAYRNPALTVDALVVCKNMRTQKFQVLLIQRGKEPFKGSLAFPGGFVDYGENPENAVKRELQEETLLRTCAEFEPQLVAVRGNPNRDPRKHTVTIAYALKAEKDSIQDMKGSDDAADCKFVDLDTAIESTSLAFDHADILKEFQAWFHEKGIEKKYYTEYMPKEE